MGIGRPARGAGPMISTLSPGAALASMAGLTYGGASLSIWT